MSSSSISKFIFTCSRRNYQVFMLHDLQSNINLFYGHRIKDPFICVHVFVDKEMNDYEAQK